MTKVELQIWTAAFGSNQPQPSSGPPDGARAAVSALYWAAAAVFAFRGSLVNPTLDQIIQLHAEALAASRAEEEA